MRPIIVTLILIAFGIYAGMTVSYGTYFGMHKTSDEKFCVSCHEMEPMVMAYKDDVHGGKGKVGASARCVDCHLPHDSLANYVFTKAKNGLVEGAIHFFGDVDGIDWHEKLKHRDKYVFDDGCLKCHGNIMDTTLSSPSKQAQKMHKHYRQLLNTDKQITCASCHFDAGHKNLRSYLNYYKPEHELYTEKMHEKKIEAQEKHKNHGIESSQGHKE